MELWLATTNRSKIKEIKDIIQELSEGAFKKNRLRQLPFIIRTLKDIENFISPEETGSSFKENAKIKSRHLLSFLKNQKRLNPPLGILAEDSGLAVECLNGAPGVRSARYSGPKASDKSNNIQLLKNLKSQKNRKARYICALSFLFIHQKGDMSDLFFEASCEGQIAYSERGAGGFGYDPLFISEGQTQTFAELPSLFKQKLSHRRKAVELWLREMEKLYPYSRQDEL